jgi:hypothetical protein
MVVKMYESVIILENVKPISLVTSSLLPFNVLFC